MLECQRVMAKDRLSGVCLVDIGPELTTDGLDVIKEYIGRNPVQRTYDEATAMRANSAPRSIPITACNTTACRSGKVSR